LDDKAKPYYTILSFVVISLLLTGVESAYEIPDVLWDKIVLLLPPPKRKKKRDAEELKNRVIREGLQKVG
jgi:hypothetical protein